ncbi:MULTISPECIES: hypothetical protein [Mesorhizobium]|uniref:hypothetical protein n=1 Tax=Mesorhizobium TaxID=68287 RepID=UPI0010C0887A|nr:MULTISPECIES: hypothetical protein [Mesorhizobium]
MADISSTMNNCPRELVRLALLDFLPGAVVSTRATILNVRERAPECAASDTELVDFIISAATGHSMTIEFDHADPAWSDQSL